MWPIIGMPEMFQYLDCTGKRKMVRPGAVFFTITSLDFCNQAPRGGLKGAAGAAP